MARGCCKIVMDRQKKQGNSLRLWMLGVIFGFTLQLDGQMIKMVIERI